MPRDENTQYEQDRLGNENRKLDTLRGQEGQQTGDSGLTEIGSADTDSVNTLYTLPDHADRVFVTRAYGFNSAPSGNNTFTLYDVELDSDGSITTSNRRSVPLTVGSASTDHYEYEGRAFEKDIGVESEFEGWVGIGLVVDHDEESEDLST